MVDEIGEIKREFRPSIENLYAGFVIGFLLFVGGCVLLWLVTDGIIRSGGDLPQKLPIGGSGWSWHLVIYASIGGFACVIAGVFFGRWSFSHISFQLSVGEKGIAEFIRNSVRIIKWDDIKKVKETDEYASVPKRKGLTKYPLKKLRSRAYILELHEGDPVVFDGNSIKGHRELVEMIKAETDPRGIPWKFV